jgi:hypothetical protein
MRNRFVRAIFGAAVLSSALAAQVPVTADGKPNLSGTWQGGGVSLNGEPGTRPAPPRPAVAPPKREPLSYQPWAVEKGKEFTAKDDPVAACLLPGVPRITSMPMPLEIVQTPEKVVILYEAFRAFRIIPINDTLEHPNDLVPTWMGDSVGRWDGDTFVVDVTGFNDKTWLSGIGSIHTEALHVVERFHLNPDRTLSYSATVEDPKALTKPWATGATLRHPPNARVEEYECIENNLDLPHMQSPRASSK